MGLFSKILNKSDKLSTVAESESTPGVNHALIDEKIKFFNFLFVSRIESSLFLLDEKLNDLFDLVDDQELIIDAVIEVIKFHASDSYGIEMFSKCLKVFDEKGVSESLISIYIINSVDVFLDAEEYALCFNVFLDVDKIVDNPDSNFILDFTSKLVGNLDFFLELSDSDLKKFGIAISGLDKNDVYTMFSQLYLDHRNRNILNEVFFKLFILFSYSSFDNLILLSAAISTSRFTIHRDLRNIALRVYNLNLYWSKGGGNFDNGIDEFFNTKIRDDFIENKIKYFNDVITDVSGFISEISQLKYFNIDSIITMGDLTKLYAKRDDSVIYAILGYLSTIKQSASIVSFYKKVSISRDLPQSSMLARSLRVGQVKKC